MDKRPAVIPGGDSRLAEISIVTANGDAAARVARLEGEIANMVAAIGDGLNSPALRQRLQAAEAELERLKAAPKPTLVEPLLPSPPKIIRAHVHELEKLTDREPVRARTAVRQALEADAITSRPAEAGRGVVAEFGPVPVQLMTGTSSESVAAGARFGTFRRRVVIL